MRFGYKGLVDNYRIAHSTNAFLRIEHESRDPSEVTALLGITPTHSVSEGSPGNAKIGPHGKVWVLASAWAVNSKDNHDHFKWLTDTIGNRGPQLKMLREQGYNIKIYCMWIGRKGGYGGPRLTPEILSRLAELGVEVYFDFGLLDLDAARQAALRTV